MGEKVENKHDDNTIPQEEIAETIKSLKTGKTARKDELAPELIKCP